MQTLGEGNKFQVRVSPAKCGLGVRTVVSLIPGADSLLHFVVRRSEVGGGKINEL